MVVYQRYIFTHLIKTFIVCCFVILSVVWITQVLSLMYLIDKGVILEDFLRLILLIIPSLLFVSLPLITICAVLYSYHYFLVSRQIFVLRGIGLSNIDIARPAIFFAFIITLFAYYVSAVLMPSSYADLRVQLRELRGGYFSHSVNIKSFTQISKFINIYVEKKLPDGSMKGIVVFDNRNPEKFTVIFAHLGRIKIDYGQPLLYLEDGVRQAYDVNNNLTKLYFSNLSIQLFDYNAKRSVHRSINDVNAYYIDELFNPPSSFTQLQQKQFIAAGYQRMIWPFYNMVLVYLGLAIFLIQPYNKKLQLRNMIYTVAGVVVVVYLHFCIQTLLIKNLSFVVFVYINISMSLLFGLWLYTKKKI